MTCFYAASLVASLVAAPLWETSQRNDDALATRFDPPKGFTRVVAAPESFATFLRELPLLAGNPDVVLHNGSPKRYQHGHLAVVDIDVGRGDLQQCADAVMRLMAEYRYARKEPVCFTATSGDPMPWERWRRGERVPPNPKKLEWVPHVAADSSHQNFRAYLDFVFAFAGTLSLTRDLTAVADTEKVEPGDVFVVGGSPGHAVLVVDVVENTAGERRFMLVQSYMPAQQIHVLTGNDGPWYALPASGEPLRTPEWTFPPGSRKRLTKEPCR